jgi:hypothetical protein
MKLTVAFSARSLSARVSQPIGVRPSVVGERTVHGASAWRSRMTVGQQSNFEERTWTT